MRKVGKVAGMVALLWAVTLLCLGIIGIMANASGQGAATARQGTHATSSQTPGVLYPEECQARIGQGVAPEVCELPLRPLPAEDSTQDGWWDAQHRGNGQGTSFIVVDGATYYLDGGR